MLFSKFVFSGSQNVDGKLDKVFQLVQAQKTSTSTTFIEEFILIFQLLAFLACAGKAPIRQQMLDESLSRVKKAGDPDNILRWCIWTKDQHNLMAMADKLPRVILVGGNGTGKTYMLDAFTMKSAKEHPDENTIFAIHQTQPSARPLLQLDLEVKYEKLRLQNVTVVTFKNLSELTNSDLTNANVCIDEINMRHVRPEDLRAIQAKSLWIVIRDIAQRQENPEEYLRTQFPEPWVIVNLSYPLRTSKTMSEKVKSIHVSHSNHSNNFNNSLHVAPNMPLGPEPLIFPRSKGTYHVRLQQVFSAVGKDKPAFIILNYDMKPTLNEIQEAKATTSHRELAESRNDRSKKLLVGIEAVKACQRPQGPPLLWFRSDTHLGTSVAWRENFIQHFFLILGLLKYIISGKSFGLLFGKTNFKLFHNKPIEAIFNYKLGFHHS